MLASPEEVSIKTSDSLLIIAKNMSINIISYYHNKEHSHALYHQNFQDLELEPFPLFKIHASLY